MCVRYLYATAYRSESDGRGDAVFWFLQKSCAARLRVSHCRRGIGSAISYKLALRRDAMAHQVIELWHLRLRDLHLYRTIHIKKMEKSQVLAHVP